MPFARIASAWAGLPRIASRPPCTAGCSVLTRPSIISGKPVKSPTSSTFSPASLSVLRVPPVETSSMPKPDNARANSTTPVLSETEMSARDARRSSSVIGVPTLSQRQPIQRQSLLLFARAPRRAGTCRRRRIGLLKAPLHARGGARMAVDDHLDRPARSFAGGEINAVLKLDLILAGVEGPYFLARRHQHDTVAVGQPGGFHRGMQVKANGEFVVGGAHLRAAVGGEEYFLAIEPRAVRRQRQDALMHDAEAVGITVVRRAYHDGIGTVLARHRNVARAAEHRRAAEHAPERRQFDEARRGCVVERDR